MNSFIARQPIFNRDKEVIAYELLYREDYFNSYTGRDGDKDSLSVIADSFYNIGINIVTEGKKAFINFTKNLIVSEIALLLPRELTIVEILENIEPSREIVDCCKKLKSKGYLLALDDFVFDKKYEELIQYVDIIKVDFTITKGNDRKFIMNKVSNKKIKFLAEKIESLEEFNEALEYGYDYFQGYYLSRPIIISQKALSTNQKKSLKILNKISRASISIDELEKIVVSDLALSYKFLRLLNSSYYGFNNKIYSIKHGMVMLGEKDIKNWLFVVLIKNISDKDNEEFVNISAIRAKFAEYIVRDMGKSLLAEDAYIAGMFSLMDVILNRPMEEILKEIKLKEDVKEALINKTGFLYNIIEFICMYEQGQWDKIISFCARYKISENKVTSHYLKSIKWLKEI
ncbi:EAL and HDOD domain-containing protein [Clostridium oryzae]|uniref:EAL domain protein n=1 Tax=Clostridium oryzae TaxID=1450648 RepID=A0A1V4I9L8_9CLOT|nr:HDOD domain-containing protein [Clostridium oryzae]OPJ56682.1 EAL domain protein [Clostridium oryzae]